ncbi:MAG TPA: Fur family transcriptional regulator [Acidimicrobiales bacterium]|jgi:Fe2+ or Zn2+ uptake regulation protein|nr:Fur family transcriptional regulator [Acidimicrobiales bacterium]
MTTEADAILDELRARGGRVTDSRRAIVGAILGSHHHITAEDLAARVQADHPDIATSTVYRTLAILAELGVVEHVHVGHGAVVYHLAEQQHQHLVCAQCGAVVEVPDAVFASLRRRLARDYGFAVEPRHVALSGRCRDCA